MDKVIENWDKILQTVKADYDVGDVAFNTWLPVALYWHYYLLPLLLHQPLKKR